MDTSDVVGLLTEPEFLGCAARGGAIAILDDASRSGGKRVAHLQTERKACSHVDLEHFREKVLANSGRHGRYCWACNSKVAERDLGAVLCAESKGLLGRS